MAENKEEMTSGQELYIRHISLFGKLVPLTIKAAIRKLVQKKEQTLTSILTGKKEHIRIYYNNLYKVLFEDSDESIDEQIETLDISSLCDVVFILNEQPNIDYIKCILDQRRDLKNYEKFASLDYKTFEMKYNALKKSLFELFNDTDDAFECKRLIYSFDETKACHIRNEVNDMLKLTEDVGKHIEIVAGYVLKSNLYTKEKTEEDVTNTNGQTNDVDEEKQAVQFVLHLRDTIVRAGETSVLMCELNKDGCQVVWSKNGEILKQTKNLDMLMDKGRHFLVFSGAIPEESGTYKCTYNDMSSSGSLIVLQEPDILIQIPLHNEQDGDVREYMQVVLSCTIDPIGKTPRWFHNNKEIEASNAKVTTVSTDYEHKLIIHNIELDDSGEYMVVFDGVTSKTSITIKDHMNLAVKQQIKQEHYKNWVKGVLGLKYLKLGLETQAQKVVKSHHEKILRDLPKAISNKSCSECNTKNLLPLHKKEQCPRGNNKHKCPCFKSSNERRQCPRNGLCSNIYDMIVRAHRFEAPAMRNTRMDQWKTDAWSVAACYLSSTKYIHSAYQYKNLQRSWIVRSC